MAREVVQETPPLHLWFSHFLQAFLWKKSKSYLSPRQCADLITDFTALYRQTDITDQVKILALTCFSSLTVVFLLHLLMEANSLLNLSCLTQQRIKMFSELCIFFFHISCTGIFIWVPSVLSIFVLQLQHGFLCTLVPARFPIIKDLAGTIRNQQNRVSSFHFWSLSRISSLEKLEPGCQCTHRLLSLLFISYSIISYKIAGCCSRTDYTFMSGKLGYSTQSFHQWSVAI